MKNEKGKDPRFYFKFKKIQSLIRRLSNDQVADSENMVSDRSKWLLVIVQEAGHVDGVTRLHKYAFLIANRIKGITNIGFYKDWMPSNYGPFSPQLANDINDAIRSHFLDQTEKTNSYGYKVGVLMPTESSKTFTSDLRTAYPKYINEIHKIVQIYQDKKLMDVLHDVYALYPQFVSQSKIRAEVGKNIYESDSWLNPEYDYPKE